jgi:MFS family permease
MLYGAKWYAAIIVAWGVVAACSSLIGSRAGFFATRLLLGLAEAGAWPSASHLLCQFYPADRCADGQRLTWQASACYVR